MNGTGGYRRDVIKLGLIIVLAIAMQSFAIKIAQSFARLFCAVLLQLRRREGLCGTIGGVGGGKGSETG